MKDYLILKDLLAYLTYENITGRDRDCQMQALMEDNAIEFVAIPTQTLIINPKTGEQTLIINPKTGESEYLYSDEPDYTDRLNTAKADKFDIYHDNNNTIKKEIKNVESLPSYTKNDMCYYKDFELPSYLDNQVSIIKEKLEDILVDFEDNKRGGFIQYLKGGLQCKINEEQELLDKFPCTKDAISEINEYLLKRQNIDLKLNFPTMEELPLSDNESEEIIMEQSVFEPKQFVKSTLIYDIYEELIDNEILLSNRNPRINFLKALTAPSPSVRIYFNCQNTIMVNVLEVLKGLFINFKPKVIENSDIFYTNGGSNMTAGNYYRFKKIEGKQKEEFEMIKAKLDSLINEAKEASE